MRNYVTPEIMKLNMSLETINASSSEVLIARPTFCNGRYNINLVGKGGCQSCPYQNGFVQFCALGFENKNGTWKN